MTFWTFANEHTAAFVACFIFAALVAIIGCTSMAKALRGERVRRRELRRRFALALVSGTAPEQFAGAVDTGGDWEIEQRNAEMVWEAAEALADAEPKTKAKATAKS